MPEEVKFKNCDRAAVFAEVRRKTETQEARSLWNRLLPEMERNGVDGAVSYLEGEFDRIGERLEQELARLAVQTQVDAAMASTNWGDGPSPTATEINQRVDDFVGEIGHLLNETCARSLSPDHKLQKAESWRHQLEFVGIASASSVRGSTQSIREPGIL